MFTTLSVISAGYIKYSILISVGNLKITRYYENKNSKKNGLHDLLYQRKVISKIAQTIALFVS